MTFGKSVFKGVRIFNKVEFAEHRCGWAYAVQALDSLHHPKGIRLDTFLEETFLWNFDQNVAGGIIPYREPWIGFWHNPLEQPDWVDMNEPKKLMQKWAFAESLKFCRGILTLSSSMSANVEKSLGLPCSALIHPTDTNVPCWDCEEYFDDPTAVHVGWWLRSFVDWTALKLPVRKVLLKVSRWQDVLEEREFAFRGVKKPSKVDYEVKKRLPNREYDALLKKSVVVLSFIATAANNGVIEALARGVPLFVNRLPAVEEYLGKDYPAYLTGVDVARRILDRPFLEDVSAYLLRRRDEIDLSQEAFRNRFLESEVFKRAHEHHSLTVSTSEIMRWGAKLP